MDRATANLPTADLDRTAAFYTALRFSISFRDDGWMILAVDGCWRIKDAFLH
jgi:predicted lactoylglutathione lyase